ncbi:MAG: CDP-diacylglycerol--glycerol-3-phosphate 3-phosphatidyltransferase [Gemmatimonadetes bacterium]|nr:CDP-diacylglycerol--glycerol-3-phosphate 3-phosphatidyltransferase [Gemmatimonadota bacterium]
MPQVNTIESNRMTMPEPHTPNRLWTVPNVLTVSRLLLTPVFLLLIFAANWYFKILALLVFTVASLTDFYDGRIARRDGTVTNFGRFMDPLADKLLVSSALIAFALLGMIEAWLIGAMLVRDVVITGLRIFAIRRGKPVVTSQLAKWKTMLQLVLVFGILVFINVRVVEAELAAQPIVLVGDISYWVLNVLVAVVTLVAVVSGVRYLIENRKTF